MRTVGLVVLKTLRQPLKVPIGEQLISWQRKQDEITHRRWLIVGVPEFFVYLGCKSAIGHVSCKHNLQPVAPLCLPSE